MQNTHRDEPNTVEDTDKELNVQSTDQENSQLAATLNALQKENLILRSQKWKLRPGGTLTAGLILSGIGGAMLFASYMLTSVILTFVGLGLTFWGVLLLYLTSPKQVHADVLNSISSSMQKSMDEVVTYMGYSGAAIFFHPKNLKGLSQGHVFIPHYTNKDESTRSKLEALNLLPYNSETGSPEIYLHPKGMFLVAPSQGLVDLFEKELGVSLGSVEFSYVQQAIPKVLIEDLKVVDEVTLENTETDSVVMSFKGGPGRQMCTFFQEHTKLGKNLGCPLCSAGALVISKVTGKPVMIKSTNSVDDKISTTYLVISS